MLSIDEAIEDLKYDIEIDMYIRNIAPQIAEWLEELKALKENSISKEAFEKMKSIAYKKGHRQGYNKALDDFVNACKEDILCQTFGLRKCDIDELAEQLKAGDKKNDL